MEALTTPPKIFISYRHKDSAAHALLLHERLKHRFGAENVFLDVAVLKPGMDWRKAIKAHASSCGILVALIGNQWLSLLKSLDQQSVVEPVDDVARSEVELALTNSVDIEVVPVLVDDAPMPAAHELPRSIRALTDQQAEQLRLAHYDQDVERLIEHLERIASEKATGAASPKPTGAPVASAAASAETERRPQAAPVAQGLRGGHHERVAKLMLGGGHVVVLLGSGVNAGCTELPNSDGLAADLAQRYDFEGNPDHLTLSEVAQYVYVTRGEPDLYLRLKENLTVECQPSTVHRFFATFPARLEALGQPRRHHLIVTTNYDTMLERAFDEAREPYDLAVYMVPSGRDKGRFVHVPWKGSPELIAVPNRYHAFPIGDDLELSRTLIVKILGAVDEREGEYGWQDNYVITEDHYIDYLSGSTIEELVPFQILQKLTSSHCLFLGYNIRDWNLRVFLKRIWGERIRASSWAVQEQADDFSADLWRECRVEFLAEALDDYVDTLSAGLGF